MLVLEAGVLNSHRELISSRAGLLRDGSTCSRVETIAVLYVNCLLHIVLPITHKISSKLLNSFRSSGHEQRILEAILHRVAIQARPTRHSEPVFQSARFVTARRVPRGLTSSLEQELLVLDILHIWIENRIIVETLY